MKTSQNIQLTIYAVLLCSTLAWLLITITNTSILAFGGFGCSGHTSGRDETVNQRTPVGFEYYQKLKEIIESPQNVIMPPYFGGDGQGDNDDGRKSNLIVSDILAKTPRINVFASLTRDFEPIASRLNDKSRNTTVLAPLNSAINALPRKPWEDPEDYERYGEIDAYKGTDGEERAKRNLQRFVEAHLVPTSPWNEGEEIATVGGGKVKWIKDGNKIFIEPGHIEVDSLASQVSNGDVWVLKSVINYR